MQIGSRIADAQQGRHIKAEASQGKLAAKWRLSTHLDGIVGVKGANILQELQDVRVIDTVIDRGSSVKQRIWGPALITPGSRATTAVALAKVGLLS